MHGDDGPRSVRVAELLGSLSLATDLAMGQPMEHGLRTCLLAVGLAGELGLDDDGCHDVYELALLRWVGCTAHAHELAGWFDDEIAAHGRAATFDFGRPTEVLADLLRHAGDGRPPVARVRTVLGALAAGRSGVHRLFDSSCEVAGRLAEPFALPPSVSDGLAHVFARWDGTGWPPGARGEAVPAIARVLHVAEDAAVFHRLGGVDAATGVVRHRSGRALDPRVVDAFLGSAAALLGETEQLSLWTAVLDAEPGSRRHLADEGLDGAFEAMADFADLKSPWTAGHSRGVARLAAAAAEGAGWEPKAVVAVRRAALVHDLGRVGVPNGIWDKRGPLDAGEWEKVRLHPYLTERILARSARLRDLGELASLHHERLDGSGYHRAVSGPGPEPARLLAAADAYQALTSARPHRPAVRPAEAAAQLAAEGRSGRLDAEAVDAVLAAAGHGRGRRRAGWPGGLTDREVEVLRLLARGHTLRQVAGALTISEKTAGHHAEHIYVKLGVRSRAAAALFAAQNDLV